jgi:eukaryotic-like serine/threonine-protein kinase
MTLNAGRKLGLYEVVAPLGAGGMGEVYRARDIRLNRDVALKVLPEAFARDGSRMARFEREAQVLASLNHPNIAAIYGLEDSGGVRALVMELVEGPTLAERLSAATRSISAGHSREGGNSGIAASAGTITAIRTSPLQLDEALHIAKQIAEALEAAHEKGIIHRDLKPANVKITPEGIVKVLDFGLARAADDTMAGGDASNSPTLTAAATQAGMIMGTAAYMAPEQARGHAVDRRADIWSFGVVLFEMLTGQRAFEGETTSDVLASVLKFDPDWNALPASTPPSIVRLLRRCLTKDRKQRLQAIGEARIAIGETLSGPPEVAAVRESPLHHSVRRRATSWAAAAILLLLAGIAGMWIESRRATPAPRWSGELLAGPSIAFWPRVSPDNRLVAFQAMVDDLTQLALTDPASGNWTVLTHDRSHGPVSNLSWSRDGSKVYFDRFDPQPVGIYSIPALGGPERLLLANAASPEPLPDGSLLIVRVDPDRRNQIYHFWPDNGRLQALSAWVDLNPSPALRVFPGGEEAAFFGTVEGTGSDNSPHLYSLEITTGRRRRLAPELSIVQSAQIFPLAVTLDGRSVLIDLPSGNLHRIVAVPRSGAGPARTLITLTAAPWSFDPGPDGSLYVDQLERPLEILRFSASGGTPEVLADAEAYPFPAWSASPVEFPDGRFLLPTLISGRPRLLLGLPGGNFSPLLETREDTAAPMARVTSDELALMVGSPPALAIASVNQGRIIRRFEATEGKGIAALGTSPDGESLYYVSSGTVWSIPSKGGNPRKICGGDGIAVDPNGRDLIVNLNEEEHVRLVRVPLSGGPQQEIRVRGDVPLIPNPVGPSAVNKDGKAVVGIAPLDSWFFRPAVLDLATGELRRIPLDYAGDIAIPGWGSDGRILATATPMRAHIWRFRPLN